MKKCVKERLASIDKKNRRYYKLMLEGSCDKSIHDINEQDLKCFDQIWDMYHKGYTEEEMKKNPYFRKFSKN